MNLGLLQKIKKIKIKWIKLFTIKEKLKIDLTKGNVLNRNI